MSDQLYTLYAVDAQGTGLANQIFIDQTQDVEVDVASAHVFEEGGGQVDPNFVALFEAIHRINFSSSKLATVLAKVGLDGIKMAGGSDHCDFCFAALENAGAGRGLASTNTKVTMAQGIIVPTGISVPKTGQAVARFAAVPSGAGTSSPLTVATTASVAGTPAASEMFKLGPVNLVGAAIDGIEGVEVDYGQKILAYRGGNGVYCTFACLDNMREPSITIRSTDMKLLHTLGANLAGVALTTGNIFLRKCVNDAVAVPDVTAQHIKINVAGNAIVRRGAVGKNGPATVEIVIRPRKSANPILNFDLASAIS